MKKEPQKIKLSETPTSKDVKKIPMPPINKDMYDISMQDDIYIRPDNDSMYTPIKNEDNTKNNT
jgi:hypothetical protein